MENTVLQAIFTRRSIRAYGPRQISEQDRDLILQAGAYAPSGSNNQSWLFTAVQNEEALERLNQVVREGFEQMTVTDQDYPAKIGAKKRAESDAYHFFYHAPTLIIASNVPHYFNAMADCACALENMFLAAHSLGLGTCWINQLTWLNDSKPVRAFLATLGIPEEHVICGAAAVGYPKGDRPAPPKRKDGTIRIIG